MQLPNVPEFIYLYYACAKVGVLPVMALPAHRYAEISYLAAFSEAAAYAIRARFRGYDYQQLARQVRQAVPVLTWSVPAPITFGSVLSASQLNATSPIAGMFTYTPAAGAVLSGAAELK